MKSWLRPWLFDLSDWIGIIDIAYSAFAILWLYPFVQNWGKM